MIRRQTANHLLHVVLCVCTLGLWIPFWLLGPTRRREWRCTDCGRPVVMPLGAELTVAIILSLAAFWLAGFLVLRHSGARLLSVLPNHIPQSNAPSPVPAQPTTPAPVQVLSNRPANAAISVTATPPASNSSCLFSLQRSRISLQTAVSEICQANGLWHNQSRTQENLGADARKYIQVDFTNLPLDEALAEVVLTRGLTYQIKDNELWLERGAQPPTSTH